MALSNSDFEDMQAGGQSAPAPQKLSKRAQRKAAKAQKKAQKQAEKQAEKQARKDAKQAKKAKKASKGQAPLAASAATVASAYPAASVQTDEAQGFVPAVAGTSYSQFAPSNVDPDTQAQVDANRKRRRRRHVVAAVLVTLLCLVGVGSAAAYMYVQQLNANLAGDEEEAQEVRESLVPAPVGDDPFYMLLVGCDDREGVDGTRADTTILARIDPGNNQVTLLSIPRDTAIEIDGYGTQKFNAAYAFGGPSGTIDAASQLCGVEISHYAEVHFEALIDIIDYIGGVDVDVPIPIDDVDAGGKLDAGMQHLTGEQAMIFARSRSYTNGDFQRTTSQRLLIEAAVNKVMNMSPAELPGLLMQITQSMTTDLSVQELLGLALAFQDEPPLVMYSALVPSSTDTWDGVSYVVTDTYLLGELMNVINAGGDPATVIADDYTVSSSQQAQEQGIELIVNLGDDVPDEGAYGAYDYYSAYGGGYYYNDYGVYGYGNYYDEDSEYDEDVDYGYDDTSNDYYSYDDTSYEDDGGYYDEEY